MNPDLTLAQTLLQAPLQWAIQWTIVAVLVLASVLYSAWRLLPVTQRLRLVEWLLPAAERAHLKWPGRLRGTLQAQALKTCGGCSGGNAPLPRASTATGAARTRSAGAPRR